MIRGVIGLQTQDDRCSGVRTAAWDICAGAVVVAAGEWSSVFGAWLGFQAPVRSLKGERLVLRFDGPPLPVLISSPMRGHMISRLDGLLSVGSTGGRDYDQATMFATRESDTRPTEAAKLELLQRAIDVFPAVQDAELVQQLAGSRPLSPDRLPIIGPVPGWDGIMLATGHTTKGVHLGPVTGRIISSWILQGQPDVEFDVDPFLPDRFADMAQPDFQRRGQHVAE